MSKTTVPVSDAVQRALRLIESHPAYRGTRRVASDSSVGVVVDLDLEVSLPFAWAAKGASPNGVRLVESVTLTFSPQYPLYAPAIELRLDFPRTLAHVMPGSLSERPVPCIYDGPLSELMQLGGIAGILNQLIDWLVNAALDRLIDPAHGWEPVRRDSLVDSLVGSGDLIRDKINKKGGHLFFRLDYLRIDFARDVTTRYGYHADLGECIPNNPQNIKDQFTIRRIDEATIAGSCVAIIVWPPEIRNGFHVVADRYLPETVVDLASLKSRAAAYGCEPELESALRWFGVCLGGKTGRGTMPYALILCARRPFHLIHHSSNVELCSYLVEMTSGTTLPLGDSTIVRPVAHQEAIAVPLLRRMSERDATSTDPWPWVQVGCGSLGSKIALHLAREGRAPSSVVDHANLRAHNAARHALIPAEGSLSWLGSKARSLAAALSGLGQSVKPYVINAVAIARDPGVAQRILPKRAFALINSTASVTVREAFASAPSGTTIPRIIETSLFAGGKISLLTVEGPNRNPDTGDLITRVYEKLREDGIARAMVYSEADSLQRRMTGDGCGTMTMVMSDALLSMGAAAMAMAISKMQRAGLPPHGRILLGRATDDEISFSWQDEELSATLHAAVEKAAAYRVHVLPRAHEKILAEVAAWPNVETGGVLLGRFSEAAQTFYIADVLPAPEDSVRSANLFVLGTLGLRSRLREYGESCNHCLYCLGTWHSHLGDFGASGTDRQTAAAIALGRPLPSVLLIRTPNAYRAILAQLSGNNKVTPT